MSEPFVVSAGPRSALEPGGALQVAAPDGRFVAVFDLDGELFALAGACLHRGGPIGEGLVRDGIVTCPYHWWRYEIRSGALVGDPARHLETYPVEVRDGEILVTLPPPAPVMSMRERLLALARGDSVSVEEKAP